MTNEEIRNKAICEMVAEGATYEATGNIFGVTRERVRQIIAKYPEYHQRIQKKLYGQCPMCGDTRRSASEGSLCTSCKTLVKKAEIQEKKKRWSRDYDRCEDCGTTERKHHSRGRCYSCIGKYYYHKLPGRKEKHKAIVKKWVEKNRDKIKEKNRIYYLKRKEQAHASQRERNPEDNHGLSADSGESKKTILHQSQ